MRREKRVTVRFSDREFAFLTEQMKKEKSGQAESGGREAPAAVSGIRKEDSISSYIREKCLAANPVKELKRMRLILTRIETTLTQTATYLKRNSANRKATFSDIPFTHIREEMHALTEQIERMADDGGNGIETH